MAKERFLIIASPMHDDCFERFSETANRARIDAGEPSDDPYAWIEASFEIRLIREGEKTHCADLAPSSRCEWLANAFVGVRPLGAYYEGSGVFSQRPTFNDPDDLELENGDEEGGYCSYVESPDPRFIAGEITVDSMRDLEEPLRRPRRADTPAGEAYTEAVWEAAKRFAIREYGSCWGAPILDVRTYRQWERECRDRVRAQSLEWSKRASLAPAV